MVSGLREKISVKLERLKMLRRLPVKDVEGSRLTEVLISAVRPVMAQVRVAVAQVRVFQVEAVAPSVEVSTKMVPKEAKKVEYPSHMVHPKRRSDSLFN